MALIQILGKGQEFLKAGFLGFNGSGKTWTAILLAIGIKKYWQLPGPIVMYDTEGGSEYVAPMVREQTGVDLLGYKGRSFDDLVGVTREAEGEKFPVLVVDSITHVWRELCLAYMKGLNDQLVADNRRPKSRMDIQDIMAVKELWSVWPDLYLNSRLHIIICGRAGFEWDMEFNEDKGKNELVKTGVKMKVETDFGFEPSLLVQMERLQVEAQRTRGRKGAKREPSVLLHQAVVLKDRFNVIDGRTCADPGFEFFKPHVDLLRPGSHSTIDTDTRSAVNVNLDGNPEWQREKRERAILCEEIQGLLLEHFPSQSAKDKAAKTQYVLNAFGTRSWTKVETLPSGQLRLGLEHIKAALATRATPEAAEEREEVTA